MRKLKILITATLFCGLLSCDSVLNVDITGDGNRVERVRNLSSFSKVYLDAEFILELSSGFTQSVSVECDSNIMSYIVTEVDNNRLNIGRKAGFDLFPRQPIIVKVVLPSLSTVEVLGGGKVNAGPLAGEDVKVFILGVSTFRGEDVNCTVFDVFAEGSTRIWLDGHFRKLQIRQKGSGDVLLSGSAKTLKLTLEGSGMIDARALLSSFTDVNLVGSGLAFCFASEILNAMVAGNGRIYYFGSPLTIEEEVSGGGALIPGE